MRAALTLLLDARVHAVVLLAEDLHGCQAAHGCAERREEGSGGDQGPGFLWVADSFPPGCTITRDAPRCKQRWAPTH